MPEAPAPPPDPERLRAVVEALVFAAEEPLTLTDLVDLFPEAGEEALLEVLEGLTRSCQASDRGLQIIRVAGGYRMTTRSEFGEWVRALFRSRNRRRLSPAALETLAIVAYKQPITTPEIQSLRGTEPTAVLQKLLDKKLLRVVGRKKVVGKPVLYGTSREFLNHFGLNSLADLPSLEEFGEMAESLSGGSAAAGDSVTLSGALAAGGAPAATDDGPFGNPEGDDGRDVGGGFEDNDDESERGDDGDDS